jgi:hypothetical protein
MVILPINFINGAKCIKKEGCIRVYKFNNEIWRFVTNGTEMVDIFGKNDKIEIFSEKFDEKLKRQMNYIDNLIFFEGKSISVPKLITHGFVIDTIHCIVMTYITGETLEKVLKNKTIKEGVELIIKIGDFCQNFYEKYNFVLKDTHENNIIIDDNDNFYFIDFENTGEFKESEGEMFWDCLFASMLFEARDLGPGHDPKDWTEAKNYLNILAKKSMSIRRIEIMHNYDNILNKMLLLPLIASDSKINFANHISSFACAVVKGFSSLVSFNTNLKSNDKSLHFVPHIILLNSNEPTANSNPVIVFPPGSLLKNLIENFFVIF